jgi:hypothetical protein
MYPHKHTQDIWNSYWQGINLSRISRLLARIREAGLLQTQLKAQLPDMASTAQQAYNTFNPANATNLSLQDAISNAIAISLSNKLKVETSQQTSPQGAYCVVKSGTEKFGVQIPASKFQIGAGPTARKLQGVQIRPTDIQIFPIK